MKIKPGVFVVPVLYHDILASGDTDYFGALLRMVRVLNVFWTEPSASNSNNGDINSIWHQADIQLQLVGWDWQLLDPGETSALTSTATCSFGWLPRNRYNSTTAVDLYSVSSLDGGIAGYGTCRAQGFVVVEAGKLTRSTVPHPQAESQLVAHEFGHYLGGLPHVSLPADNLMADTGPWGPSLTATQVQSARQYVANSVSSTPATDYWRDQ